jgi:SAM-dependent methyltransferase
MNAPRQASPMQAGGTVGGQPFDYQLVNRQGWDLLSRAGCDSSAPYGPAQFRRARAYLDGDGWLPWRRIGRVLCLAAGGGQQAPLFAWLGAQVTVVDLSPEQLARDREIADRYGLAVECVEADMLDLTVLGRRRFDLVYQPVSVCYVPDVARLHREVHRVLAPGGLYRVEHWNPVHMQLADQRWDGGYRLGRPQRSDQPVPWSDGGDPDAPGTVRCLHYIHSFDQLLGSLCDAGFVILRYRERWGGDATAPPGSPAHVAAYVPPFLRLLARRLPARRRTARRPRQPPGR